MDLLYLTAPGALASAIALSFAVPALVRRSRLDALATLTVVPEHRVELPAGDAVLHLAGPLGAVGLGPLSFELFDAAGNSVPSSPVLLRSRRSSDAWGVLLARHRFRVPQPGAYRLRVGGIATGRDLTDCRLVLARPQDVGLALSIVNVVLAAVMLIICSVLSLLLWLTPAAMAATPTEAAASVSATTPQRDSPERRALIDAVRERAGLGADRSRLRVQHLKVGGRWAYFAGNEVVRVGHDEWQETDLSIEALLERSASGWRVAEYWSLPTETRLSRREFALRVDHRREQQRIPAAIFPGTR